MPGIDQVDEDEPRLAVLPGLLGNGLEDPGSGEPPRLLAGAGVDQGIFFPSAQGRHEALGHRHGDVEVDQFPFAILGGDEGEDIRVIDTQDSHVRPAPGPPLLDRLGVGIEDAHEGDGT